MEHQDLPTYSSTHLSNHVLTHLPTSLPTHPLTYLAMYQLTYLPTYQHTHLPTYPPNQLATTQPTYLPTYLPRQSWAIYPLLRAHSPPVATSPTPIPRPLSYTPNYPFIYNKPICLSLAFLPSFLLILFFLVAT